MSFSFYDEGITLGKRTHLSMDGSPVNGDNIALLAILLQLGYYSYKGFILDLLAIYKKATKQSELNSDKENLEENGPLCWKKSH